MNVAYILDSDMFYSSKYVYIYALNVLDLGIFISLHVNTLLKVYMIH